MTRVSSDRDWQVTVTSSNKGSCDAAFFELRRHLTLAFQEGPTTPVAGLFAGYRVGRPYRAWDTSELQATIDRNPIIINKGVPVRVYATQTSERTNITDAEVAAARDAAATPLAVRIARTAAEAARSSARAAGDAAQGAAGTIGNIAGAIGGGVATGAGLAFIGPILLAISGLVVLYIYRKPLLAFARGMAK